METVFLDSYGGIFKFVWSKKARSHFSKGRGLTSENNVSNAKEEFIKAREATDKEDDIKVLTLLLEEIERFEKYKIQASTKPADFVDWKLVSKRRAERLDEDFDRLPQGIFILKMKTESGCPLSIIGRKTLSNLWLQNLIPEIFCSQIRADMFLGVLSDWRITDTKVVTYFHPITSSEKLWMFNDVVTSRGKGFELVFPFPLVKTVTRKEFTSPSEGWDVDTYFDHALSSGEEHIREVSVGILRRLGLTSHRLYDPACSTGVFLNSLKQAFPECVTIGQDLSQKMCEVAKSRIDQVYCGSAIQPMIETGSAHCVFIRFLNSEVVTTSEAEQLLSALLPTVAIGGVIVTFGHTPVLLSSANFRSIEGFELLDCVAVSMDASSIFQYYVIRRAS